MKWVDIPGYKGFYKINRLSQVKSLPRYCRVRNGKRLVHSIILKQVKKSHGYAQVTLCNDHGKRSVLVHIIVARVFIDNPHNLPEVNHKDGNKMNNAVDNLEWVTKRENSTHSRINSKKKSKYPGVLFRKDRNRWVAKTRINGRHITFGSFHSEKMASIAYTNGLKELGVMNRYATL